MADRKSGDRLWVLFLCTHNSARYQRVEGLLRDMAGTVSRGQEVPEDEMLQMFRQVRDEIELKIKDWLERPEDELRKLKQQRERLIAER